MASLKHAFSDLEIDRNAICTTRDDAKLVADVYTPKAKGTFPVILMRQPYGRDIASTVVYAQPSWIARQGYIVVIQDVRGRGDSEGTFYPFRNEGLDGYDSVEWAAKLPQSNGRVGMYGFSYQGSTQLLAAVERPPSLTALAPHMTAFDLYSGWFYRNGILQQNTTLAWANQMLRENVARERNWTLYDSLENSWRQPSALFKQLPIAKARPLTEPDGPSFAREWLEHDEKDDYWNAFDMLKHADVLAAYPMFHIAGWYDFYLRGSIDGFLAMHKRQPDRHALVCGPWGHIPWGDRIGTHSYPPSARMDTNALLIQWFDHYLKEGKAGIPFESQFFVLGKNIWESRASLAGTVHSERFLQSQGNANSRFGDGSLQTDNADSPSDQFNYDPEVPVLGPGCDPSGNMQWGPSDLSSQQQSNNLLVYTSEALTTEFKISGQIVCHLFASSSASHTAFVVRFSRLDSTGKNQFLCLGATRASPEDCDNEGVFRLSIDLDHTVVQFFAGDRIQIDISSSAFPLLARHPNTDTRINQVERPCHFERAIQVIHHSKAYPSRIVLPQCA